MRLGAVNSLCLGVLVPNDQRLLIKRRGLKQKRHRLCGVAGYTMCSRLLTQEAITLAALGQIRCVSRSSCYMP